MKPPGRRRIFALAAAASLAVAGTAQAHHSFAMFEPTKTVTLKGTVRSFEWTNPHTWLWIYVTEVDGNPVADQDGKPVIWGIEGGAPGEAVRSGRSKDDVKPGDKITMTVRPLKDGRPGGSGGAITLADGRVIGASAPARGNAAPSAPTPPP